MTAATTATPGVSVITSVGPDHLEHLPAAAASVAALAEGAQWIVVLDGGRQARSAAHSGDVTEVAREDVGDLGSAVRTALAGGVEVQVLTTVRAHGTFTARTHGLGVARRRWTVNLDADDRLLPGMNALRQELERRDRLWGVGHLAFEDGAREPAVLARGRVPAGRIHDLWAATGMRRTPVHPGTLLVDTRLALAVGGWPAITFAADTGLLLAVSEQADGWMHDDDVVLYRRWDCQISGSPDKPATFAERAALLSGRVLAARALGLSPSSSGAEAAATAEVFPAPPATPPGEPPGAAARSVSRR